MKIRWNFQGLPAEALQQALELQKALALEPSANSHTILSMFMFFWKFRKSLWEAEKAVSLCPNSAPALRLHWICADFR